MGILEQSQKTRSMGSCTLHPAVAILYPAAKSFAPGCCLLSTRMYHIRNPLPPLHIRNLCSAAFHPDDIWNSTTPLYSIRMSYIQNSGAGWERIAFHLFRMQYNCHSVRPKFPIFRMSRIWQTYPDPMIALTWRVSQPNVAQCSGVLLKFPKMCDRHLQIFIFRYLPLDILFQIFDVYIPKLSL